MQEVGRRSVPRGETAQQMLVPDGTYLGWHDGPVLVSGWYPYAPARDASAGADTALQALVNASSTEGIPAVILPGAYRCDAAIMGKANAVIFGYGATLVRNFDPASTSAVLDLDNAVADADGMRIVGLEIDGQNAAMSNGGHAIRIRGSRNVMLDDLTLHDATWDGLYIGRDTGGVVPSDITVRHMHSTGNGRQGTSITAGERLLFDRCAFNETLDEQAPSAGVDIEPNSAATVIDHITFRDCEFRDNAGAGLIVSLRDAKTAFQGRVTLINPVITGNGSDGVRFSNVDQLTIENPTITGNGRIGLWSYSGTNDMITVRSGTISENQTAGIDLENHLDGSLRNVLLDGVRVWKNGQDGSGTKPGILIGKNDNAVDRITIAHCDIGAPSGETQQYGIATRQTTQQTGTALTNVRIIDNDLRGNTGAALSLQDQVSSRVVRGNIGYVTAANGAATITSAATSVAVTHGLSVTPDLADIRVTPTNNLGTATTFWISSPSSTQFTINVDADPGATTATFVWEAVIR